LGKQILSLRRKMRRNSSSQIGLPLLLASKSLMILHNSLLFLNDRLRERRNRKKLLHLLHQLRKNLAQLRRMLHRNKNTLKISSEFKQKRREKLLLRNRHKNNRIRQRTK
jgi:hypothetical protein